MVQKCTEEETLKALRGMGLFKVPRPDGYQAVFCKNTWSVTGVDVMVFVRGILGGGDLISRDGRISVGADSQIQEKPATMKEFGPLSLCNKVYKLVSKIIVKLLREAWKTLISPC